VEQKPRLNVTCRPARFKLGSNDLGGDAEEASSSGFDESPANGESEEYR
jgi:hypothetical protein